MNTQIVRLAERAHYDRATIDPIIDAALIAHVAVVLDGNPVVLPFACARVGNELLLHGSVKAGVLSAVTAGSSMCATITHIDALIIARSAFHCSMNYRSVVIQGRARAITDPAEKVTALDAFVERLLPGHRDRMRAHTLGELQATSIVALALENVSAKARAGGVEDAPGDRDPAQWAGVLPLRLVFGAPQADASVSSAAPLPAFIAASI